VGDGRWAVGDGKKDRFIRSVGLIGFT
jgi:hypothetical protein